VDNIKKDLAEIGWGGMDWSYMTQDKGMVEGSCEHGNELPGSTECSKVLE
jgi:hypothetical protein